MIYKVRTNFTARAVPTRVSINRGHGPQERAFAHPTVLSNRNTHYAASSARSTNRTQ
jgi:hypothetical protein